MKTLLLMLFFIISFSGCLYAEKTSNLNSPKESYKLIYKKSTDCDYLKKMFDTDIEKYGEIKYQKHPEFNFINWKYGIYERVLDSRNYKKGMRYSYFDINNDKKKELVIKEDVNLYGKIGKQFFVFLDGSNIVTNDKFKIENEKYKRLPGIKSSGKWPYKINTSYLKGEYKNDYYTENNILSFIDINPFELNGNIYLSIDELYKIDGRPMWHIISEFKNDSFVISGTDIYTNKLNHVCIFENTTSVE